MLTWMQQASAQALLPASPRSVCRLVLRGKLLPVTRQNVDACLEINSSGFFFFSHGHTVDHASRVVIINEVSKSVPNEGLV